MKNFCMVIIYIMFSVNAEADAVTLLPIYSSRIMEHAQGRPLVADYQISISYAMRDRKPQFVVRFF